MIFPGIYKNVLVPFKIAGNCFRTKLQIVFKISRDRFDPLSLSLLHTVAMASWRHAAMLASPMPRDAVALEVTKCPTVVHLPPLPPLSPFLPKFPD